MKRAKRSYDHRIKRQIALTRNPHLFPGLNIPVSTTKNWINRGVGDVVSHEIFEIDREKLEQDFVKLQKQVAVLESQLGLLNSVFKIFGFILQYQRIIACVEDPKVIAKILNHLGLSTEIPEPVHAAEQSRKAGSGPRRVALLPPWPTVSILTSKRSQMTIGRRLELGAR